MPFTIGMTINHSSVETYLGNFTFLHIACSHMCTHERGSRLLPTYLALTPSLLVPVEERDQNARAGVVLEV